MMMIPKKNQDLTEKQTENETDMIMHIVSFFKQPSSLYAISKSVR